MHLSAFSEEEMLWKAAPQSTNSRKTWEIDVNGKPVGAHDFDLKGKWHQNIIDAHRYKRNVAPILSILYCFHGDAFDFNYYYDVSTCFRNCWKIVFGKLSFKTLQNCCTLNSR